MCRKMAECDYSTPTGQSIPDGVCTRGELISRARAETFGPAQFVPDGFHGKVTQPLWIALACLGKGDDMFGDN